MPIDRQALQNWAKHERALYAAGIAISRLESAGVRPLPVKGVLLAQQVYDPAERPIADVDLLIAPTDLRRALAVARGSHWELVWDSKALGNVNFIVDGIPFDVACSVGPAGVSLVGTPTFLARAVRSMQPLGFAHWQIELHDHALLLAIDAFKDKLGQGKPWAREDLVRIAQVEGFSPATLVERAEQACLRTLVAIVSHWIVSQAPSHAWSEIGDRLRTATVRRSYIARYERALASRNPSIWQRWRLSAMARAVSDLRRRRILALALGAVGTAAYVVRHGSISANAWDTTRETRNGA